MAIPKRVYQVEMILFSDYVLSYSNYFGFVDQL